MRQWKALLVGSLLTMTVGMFGMGWTLGRGDTPVSVDKPLPSCGFGGMLEGAPMDRADARATLVLHAAPGLAISVDGVDAMLATAEDGASLPISEGPHRITLTTRGGHAFHYVTPMEDGTTTLDIPVLGDDPAQGHAHPCSL